MASSAKADRDPVFRKSGMCRTGAFHILLFALITGFTRAEDISATLNGNPWSVTFKNNTNKTLRLLKPLDGSCHGWIFPHYTFVFQDPTGKILPLPSRCALFGYPYTGTKWPDDYLIILDPGASKAINVRPRQIEEAKGKYTVSFTYVFPDNADPTPGGPYPSDLWTGEVSARPITVEFK